MKLKKKRKRTATVGGVRFLLLLPMEYRSRIAEIRDWYRTVLKTKSSAAFVIRSALDDFLPKELARLKSAEKGRFHVKVRSETKPRKAVRIRKS